VPVALVSEVVPPSWSGSAVLISRLLDDEDPDAYRLLTSAQGRYEGAHIGGLATPCFRLPPARTRYLSRNNKLLYASSAMAGAGAGIVRRAYGIARIARRERCRAIVVFTGDFHDVPAAHVSAWLLRVPLYVYMLDYYSHRELCEPAWKRLSPPIERVVVRRARRVICGTDTLARALAERYGVQSAVIHHPADLSLYLLAPRPRPAPGADSLRIVYTGTIYDAHVDAVADLLTALQRPEAPAGALHVHGGQSARELGERGLQGPFVVQGHLDAAAVAAAQQGADVLFLPLAFRSQYPEVIRTSAPMKFGEYLAAGGPILVHAPPDAFVSEYCRRHDCGLVVDDTDPASLVDALQALAGDDALRARLMTNAQARARADFAIDVARARFAEVLGL
jgi:glycosyltransferase involved in cell wall biosynthesis